LSYTAAKGLQSPAMRIDVNGTQLWFDVDGVGQTPRDHAMVERPTVVLLHGGPGSFDHTYLKPDFHRLTEVAQVIYLDLRDHWRSGRGDPTKWSYEICADDVRAFCDALGIVRPIVHGHSLGGFIAMTYGIRHPGHPGALVLDSTAGRFDIPRMVESFRKLAGDETAAIVERAYTGSGITPEEWAPCWKLFGPGLPDRALVIPNIELNDWYLPRMGRFNVLDQLERIECPTLVVRGSKDPAITAEVARELHAALPSGLARLETIEDAGHFPWMDRPERYWPLVMDFVRTLAARSAPSEPSESRATGAARRA
jgi:pimeloyl-ACP methyl ester carboxylesterase